MLPGLIRVCCTQISYYFRPTASLLLDAISISNLNADKIEPICYHPSPPSLLSSYWHCSLFLFHPAPHDQSQMHFSAGGQPHMGCPFCRYTFPSHFANFDHKPYHMTSTSSHMPLCWLRVIFITRSGDILLYPEAVQQSLKSQAISQQIWMLHKSRSGGINLAHPYHLWARNYLNEASWIKWR